MFVGCNQTVSIRIITINAIFLRPKLDYITLSLGILYYLAILNVLNVILTLMSFNKDLYSTISAKVTLFQ